MEAPKFSRSRDAKVRTCPLWGCLLGLPPMGVTCPPCWTFPVETPPWTPANLTLETGNKQKRHGIHFKGTGPSVADALTSFSLHALSTLLMQIKVKDASD